MRRLHQLDFRELETFLAVCETRSMTAAASRLSVTQSAVSYSIGRLEKAIGERLIDRGVRPISITPAGEALQAAALQIAESLKVLDTTIDDIRAGKLRRIRIGLNGALSVPFVSQMVKRLGPDVEEIMIQSDLAGRLRHDLIGGHLDVAVMTDPIIDEDHFARRHILTEPYILAVPASFGPVADLDDLRRLTKALPLVRWLSGSEMGRDVEAHLRRLKVVPPRVFEFDGRHAVIDMVAQGAGWAIATPITAYDIWARSRAVALHPFPGSALHRSLTAVYREGRYERVVERFVAEARTIIREIYLKDLLDREPWLETLIHVPRETNDDR